MATLSSDQLWPLRILSTVTVPLEAVCRICTADTDVTLYSVVGEEAKRGTIIGNPSHGGTEED